MSHRHAVGYVRTHIVMPGVVYGIAHGPVHDAGIAKPVSTHIPALIKCSLDRRRGAMFGPGTGVWPVIHIDDGAWSASSQTGHLTNVHPRT